MRGWLGWRLLWGWCYEIDGYFGFFETWGWIGENMHWGEREADLVGEVLFVYTFGQYLQLCSWW